MKAFFRSKTTVAQVVGFVAMGLAMFGLDIPVDLQAKLATGISAGWAIVNIVIRYFTTESMADKAARLKGENA